MEICLPFSSSLCFVEIWPIFLSQSGFCLAFPSLHHRFLVLHVYMEIAYMTGGQRTGLTKDRINLVVITSGCLFRLFPLGPFRLWFLDLFLLHLLEVHMLVDR